MTVATNKLYDRTQSVLNLNFHICKMGIAVVPAIKIKCKDIGDYLPQCYAVLSG